MSIFKNCLHVGVSTRVGSYGHVQCSCNTMRSMCIENRACVVSAIHNTPRSVMTIAIILNNPIKPSKCAGVCVGGGGVWGCVWGVCGGVCGGCVGGVQGCVG